MTEYMMNSSGSWRRSGRQPASGLMPRSLNELLLGQPGLHRVALEALLDLLELRLEELHPALRDELLAVERDQDRRAR